MDVDTQLHAYISSANSMSVLPFPAGGKSEVKKIYKVGDSILPCGTPLWSWNFSLSFLFILICAIR